MSPKLHLVPGLILPIIVFSVFVRTGLTQGPLPIVQVTGKVRVNGGEVRSGTPIFSGVTIHTAATNSSAVISLGKLGRLEILEDTELKIEFSDARMVLLLLKPGRIRLSTPAGVGATVRSAEIQAIVDKAAPNDFSLETSCDKVTVETRSGRVLLGVGGPTLVVKEILAGSSETVDTPKAIGCKVK